MNECERLDPGFAEFMNGFVRRWEMDTRVPDAAPAKDTRELAAWFARFARAAGANVPKKSEDA